ncbi:DBF4-type zinc finger-containing protein 2 [Phyllostomus hastatus]|uniref:DBF4-type zinc finger-containing protein 2 n=1 Tax=Phyllostomus hastatus TaxID=9423 RepID=UPI001E67EBAA|nr:DBF4-type zinc finger-containing protein 2 [Phyllostomus hastatus]
MQNRQGYCSYCCVRYNNLEQHMASPQHRYLTAQNRQRMGSSSLMERFLQDVLRHHPYHYQESRSRQNERLLRNNASSSEAAPVDDSVSEEMADDATGARGEIATKSVEPIGELYSRPSKSQECTQGVSTRPSVIQKLEKGQQQPLEFVYKIGSGLKELSPVGVGQATNNGQNLIHPSVISTAPASRLPESSYDRPRTTNTTRLPLAAHLDSVSRCDPNKVDRSIDQQDRGSRNPVLSSRLETSSVLYQKPKESNRKSVCINSDKLILQGDVKSRGKTLSTGFKSHAFMGTEGSLKCESLSKLTAKPAINPNKTDRPPNKRIFEYAIPKHHEKLFSNMNRTQEEKHVVLNKSVFLRQRSSGSSKMEYACGSPQSAPDHPEEAAQDLWSAERVDQEDKAYESRGSEMSFDCSSSFNLLTDQSKVTAKDINPSKEAHAGLQHKSNTSCVSEISSDHDGPLQLATNRTHVIVKGSSVQKAVPIRLVDESYDSSDSEMNFDCDTSPQSTDDYRQQPAKVDLPKEAHVDLVDKNYGSSSSESANEQPHGALGEINPKELNVDMEVKSYGCSSSELTFESDPPPLSVTEQSELDVEEIRKRHINLEGTDQPEVAVKEMIIQKEDCEHLGRKNDETNGSEISLDSYVAPLSVTNSPGVLVKRLNLQKEEKEHFESKENEPSGSELSLNYDSFHSIIGHSEDPIREVSLQKEEHAQLENKNNGPDVPEIILKSYISHLVTDHPDRAVKEVNHQKEEHVNLQDKGNELSVSETSLDFGIPLQSVIQRTDVVLKEIWLQKEKHAQFEGKSTEFSGSEINLDCDVSRYSVTEPQIVVKEVNVQNEEYVLENKSDKYSGSEVILGSDILPQSMSEKPQIAVLKEDHVDPEEESTESRGFEINLDIGPPRHSVIEQSQLVPLKEKHVDLEDTSSESSNCKVNFDSDNPLQPLTEQFQEVIKKTNLWKVEDIGLENKVDKPSGSKLIQDSDVSPQSVPDQPEASVKQTNLENESHVYMEDNNSQYSSSEMSLDSDFLAQSTVDQPQITIMEKEHIELEDKHNKSCGSEISFDSDDPLQSVADQLRETVKKISLWKDEVDVEEKRDKSKSYEVMYDSNVLFQSVAGQNEEIVKEINLWKKPVDLEGKIVEPSAPKISFDSDEPFHSVANEIQEATTEINLLREGHVCLHDKVYEPNDSEVIYVTNVPLQSAIEEPHILQEEHADLEDKSNDLCGPEISFASDDPRQSVTDHLEKAVKVSLWKEDCIYLGDKSYKLGDFEVRCDSDAPVQLVVDQSPVAVKQINLQKKDHDDLENKNCEPSVSEIKCDSGIHFQLDVDQPQVVCKEMNLQGVAHLGMEEKTSDSEVMSDSDVPLQIVVNEFQVSVKEANLQKMLLVDLVTGDSDCEMVSDSDIPCQPVIDSPQVTVEGIDCINAKSFELEGECCDCCDTELGYVCEGSPQSVSDQSRKTFKVVNQKKDYIILEESGCESYGADINFQIDPSHQSMTYQSPGSDKKMAKYIEPEEKSCKSKSPKRNKWEGSSQPVTHQLQKADGEDNFWKDPESTSLKEKSHECSVSGIECNASESEILQMAEEDNLLKLKPRDLGNVNPEPCGSGVNFQRDPSLQSGTDHPQEAVNKPDLFKKTSFDKKEMKRDSHSSSAPKVESVRKQKKAKGVVEENTDEPVLEALPHVPPSFVGKTWSQIMREDDMKINALVKEFKEGRFHCYFDDDSETRKVKKKNLNEEKMITSADLNDTAFIQVLLDCDYNIDDFSVALDKPSHHPTEKRPYEQTWRVASRCQAVKVSHGTQTNLMSYLVTKGISGQEEDSPTLKRLLLHNDKKPKKKIEIGTVEFLESYTNILKPLHPNALVYVLSSNIKLKEGESFNFSKIRRRSDKNNQDISIQYKYKPSSFNYYDPLNKQIVINPPLNIEVPESDRNNWVQIHFSDLNPSVGDDDAHVQSSTLAPFMTLSVRHELMSHQGASGSSVFLAKSDILNSSEVPKKSNFQLTLLNGDAAKASPKSVRNESLEGKKKGQRRKVTSSKTGLLKKIYRPVLLQQKNRVTSEKQSIWIQTKLSDIIRKYISKYSVFLRRKYQSRRAFIRMHLKKKKPVVSRLKKAKRPAKLLSNSAPSAGAEEQFRAIKSPSPKQPVRGYSRTAGTKRRGHKKRPRKKQRKRPKPVKIYDLRSLYSQVPYSDRMMTRLLHKLLLSKAKQKYLY